MKQPPSDEQSEFCLGCVYYPPNLPEAAYPSEDYQDLQKKSCSYDYSPGDKHCMETRKTSCSVINLESPAR